MSPTPGEAFDSGAVLSRATPVLTFSSAVRNGASVVAAGVVSQSARPEPRRVVAEGAARPRIDTPTPTPGAVTLSNAVTRPRASELPVIKRIVRDRRSDRGPLAALAARVARLGGSLQRSGVGTLVIGALGLATLGAIAGLGMRSLSDEAIVVSGAAHTQDATAAERMLARAPLADRVDHQGPTVPAASAAPALAPAPALAHAPAPTHGAPAHALSPAPSAHSHAPAKKAPSHVNTAPHAFAAAHASHAAQTRGRAASTSAIAHR